MGSDGSRNLSVPACIRLHGARSKLLQDRGAQIQLVTRQFEEEMGNRLARRRSVCQQGAATGPNFDGFLPNWPHCRLCFSGRPWPSRGPLRIQSRVVQLGVVPRWPPSLSFSLLELLYPLCQFFL